MTARKPAMQRIRVDAQGYDRSGAYWGAGPDVFIAASADGSDEITVRARSAAEARQEVAAELARSPGEPRAEAREPIGGNAPRKTRYQIEWLNPLTNERITIRITHARDYLSQGTDHIEVESTRPARAALPITETGYRSHFIKPLELINAGGPVTFVTAWLVVEAQRTANRKAWTKAAKAEAICSSGPRRRARSVPSLNARHGQRQSRARGRRAIVVTNDGGA
jgi:hypothetical protein